LASSQERRTPFLIIFFNPRQAQDIRQIRTPPNLTSRQSAAKLTVCIEVRPQSIRGSRHARVATPQICRGGECALNKEFVVERVARSGTTRSPSQKLPSTAICGHFGAAKPLRPFQPFQSLPIEGMPAFQMLKWLREPQIRRWVRIYAVGGYTRFRWRARRSWLSFWTCTRYTMLMDAFQASFRLSRLWADCLTFRGF
jgi:hypothetical protein